MEQQENNPVIQENANNTTVDNEEVTKKVRMAGLGMLAMLLFVVGAWVFFVMYNREKADEIVSRSAMMQQKETPITVLENDLDNVEIELNALDEELESELNLDFTF